MSPSHRSWNTLSQPRTGERDTRCGTLALEGGAGGRPPWAARGRLPPSGRAEAARGTPLLPHPGLLSALSSVTGTDARGHGIVCLPR